MNDVIFPDGFLFGAGGAGHQIEGDNIHSQFNQWERENRPCFPEKSGKACNHWEMYREDIRMMADLKFQIYRMSVEWSRIEPENGVHDEAALARYVDMLERLNACGIRVSVTLLHGSHPNWFEQLGGFSKRENIRYFLRHIDYLVPKIKDYVYNWNVLNEFNMSAADDLPNMLLAHARGYHTVKKYTDAPVSSTHALIHWAPYRPADEFDQTAARLQDWGTNGFLLHAIRTGELLLPRRDAEYMPEVKDSMDYWAINYYTRHMASARSKDLRGARYGFDRVCMIDSDFYLEEFYPDGLVEELPRFSDRPIFIMENGVACDDDRIRIIYIARYLSALKEAMDQGADVRGYVHWSVMDNYEWGSFLPRFGLVGVDFKTFERTIKPSAYFFREIIENHGITEEIRKKYIEPLCDIQTYCRPGKKRS